MDFVNYLQGEGRHSINVLLAIYALTQKKKSEGKSDLTIDWKEIRQWINQNMNTTLSDSTYRNRREELEKLGMIELSSIVRLKSSVKLTPKGEHFATMLAEFVEKVKAEEQK